MCREDRVMQHLEHPSRVLDEMERVTRAGGRIVCASPDWRTFTLDVGGGGLTPRVLSAALPTCTCHPHLGVELRRMLRARGLCGVPVTAHTLVMEGRDAVEAVWPLEHVAAVAADRRVRTVKATTARTRLLCSRVLTSPRARLWQRRDLARRHGAMARARQCGGGRGLWRAHNLHRLRRQA